MKVIKYLLAAIIVFSGLTYYLYSENNKKDNQEEVVFTEPEIKEQIVRINGGTYTFSEEEIGNIGSVRELLEDKFEITFKGDQLFSIDGISRNLAEGTYYTVSPSLDSELNYQDISIDLNSIELIKPESKCNLEDIRKEVAYYEVVAGCDDYLFQIDDDYNAEKAKNNTMLFEQIGINNDIVINVVPVPRSSYVLNDKVPSIVNSTWNEDGIESLKTIESDHINIVDIRYNLLMHKDEYIYFKTDHHWTQRGAYYGYEAIMEELGIDYPVHNDEDIVRDDNKFFGAYGSAYYSAAERKEKDGDYIEYYNVKPSLELYGRGENVYLTEEKYLSRSVKYNFFDHWGVTSFSYKGIAENDRKLLFIKDSYGAAMYPFLTESFSEIHIIDIRSNFDTGSLNSYIEKYGITDVVVLYSTPTLLDSRFYNIR